MFLEKLQTSSRLVLTLAAVVLMFGSFYFLRNPLLNRASVTQEQPAESPEQKQQQQQQQQQTSPTQTTPSNSQTTTGCNTSQRSSFTNQYNSQVAAENTRHATQVAFLNSTGASTAQEDATHASNLAAINSQYQANLRSVGC